MFYLCKANRHVTVRRRRLSQRKLAFLEKKGYSVGHTMASSDEYEPPPGTIEFSSFDAMISAIERNEK